MTGLVRKSLCVSLLAAAWTLPAVAGGHASFFAGLTGGQEVPPVESPGLGSAVFGFDPDTRELSYEISIFGLQNPIAGHVHAGAFGQNGPVVVPLASGPFTNPLRGRATLSEESAQRLLDGGMYVNFHTTQHPGGEIRGQLEAVPLHAMQVVFAQTMSPLEEVPPRPELDASGHSIVVFDLVHAPHGPGKHEEHGLLVAATVTFFMTYAFDGPVTLTGFHIHDGARGTNGPVVINTGLRELVDPDGTGTLTFPVPIAPDRLGIVEDFLHDPRGFYINLHSTDFPGGALRSQLAERRVQ
jgi:hypothetical protein